MDWFRIQITFIRFVEKKQLVDEFKSAQNKLAGEELCKIFGYTPLRLGIFVGIDILHFPPIPRRDKTSRFLGRAISTVQEGWHLDLRKESLFPQ